MNIMFVQLPVVYSDARTVYIDFNVDRIDRIVELNETRCIVVQGNSYSEVLMSRDDIMERLSYVE